jgi:hypothetical protein
MGMSLLASPAPQPSPSVLGADALTFVQLFQPAVDLLPDRCKLALFEAILLFQQAESLADYFRG